MASTTRDLHGDCPSTGSTRARRSRSASPTDGRRASRSLACNLGNFAFFAGRWDEAVEDYRSSRQVAMESGNAFGALETDVNLGEVLVNLGRADEARVGPARCGPGPACLGRGVQRLVRGDAPGAGHLALGELDQAEAEIAPLVERFTSMGTRLTAFEAVLVRAEIATSAGEPARATGAPRGSGGGRPRGGGAAARAAVLAARRRRSLALGRPRRGRAGCSTRDSTPLASRSSRTRRPCCCSPRHVSPRHAVTGTVPRP